MQIEKNRHKVKYYVLFQYIVIVMQNDSQTVLIGMSRGKQIQFIIFDSEEIIRNNRHINQSKLL